MALKRIKIQKVGPKVIFCALLALPASLLAQDTVYSYRGLPFSSVVGSPGVDTTDSVAGTFTVSSPLPSNLPFTDIKALVKTATFSVVGAHPQTIALPVTIFVFQVSTDSAGRLAHWNINIFSTNFQSPFNIQILNTFTALGAPLIGDFFFYNPTGTSQAHNSVAGTWSSSASRLPDLSITNVRPVQVVFGADIDGDGETDLVLGKPTAVLATVHVDNPNALHSSVNATLQFEGVTYNRGFQPSELDGGGNVQLTFVLVPTQAGPHQQMVATVDPANLIPESNENNNLSSTSVSVRLAKILDISYVEITDCLLPFNPPNCYGPLDAASATEAFSQSRDFILATYPIPNIQAQAAGAFLGDPIPLEGLINDMDTAYRIGQRNDPNADRVVALVPPDYFAYHLKSNVAGLSTGSSNGVLASVNFWSTPAHEIGHKYGLHRPTSWIPAGPGEEYQTNPPGNCASGFSVTQNLPITDGICFMGSVPQSGQRSFTFDSSCSADPAVKQRRQWIDKNDYQFLFNQLKPVGDPDILILSGFVLEDDSVKLSPWYLARNGTSGAPDEGDYTIEFVDSTGSIVGSDNFPVSFDISPDYEVPLIHTGISLFAFPVSLPAGLLSVRIRHADKVLNGFDLSSKLLADAVDAIPNRGFTDNADQRRTALKNKVQAIGQMLTVRAFAGATMALKHDLMPKVSKWLIDSYATQSPLEVSKPEVLDLIDEVISRTSTAH
jgi:hypothetical protein